MYQGPGRHFVHYSQIALGINQQTLWFRCRMKMEILRTIQNKRRGVDVYGLFT